jgi:hypothetical protein
VGIQEVRWDEVGTVPTGEYTFSYGNENANHEPGKQFFLNTRIMSAVKRVEFVSDRMSYTLLRDRWCAFIVLNVQPQQRIKLMTRRTASTRRLERVFDKFPKYHMKIF